jgi:hypothetical protein
MRSDLVFGAIKDVPNRYLLSQLASKATRKLHRSGTRMQDTTNGVFLRFSRGNPTQLEQASRERLLVPLRPKLTCPAIAHKSEDVPLPPGGERIPNHEITFN